MDQIADLKRLLDRQAIIDCLHRYTRGIDRLDRELVLSAYHPDAQDDHVQFVGNPRQFVEWVFPLLAEKKYTNHLILNHTCELQGETAHCETHMYYMGVNADGSIEAVNGRYVDRLERRDEWRIACRIVVIDWVADVVGKVDEAGTAAMTVNTHASRDRSDVSYIRPLQIPADRLRAMFK